MFIPEKTWLQYAPALKLGRHHGSPVLIARLVIGLVLAVGLASVEAAPSPVPPVEAAARRFPGTGDSADTPLIEIFPAAQTHLDSATWAAARDAAGRLFIGCSDGLLVFNGSVWRTVPVPGAKMVRGVVVDPVGRIWVAALNTLGFFTRSGAGEFVFHNLTDRLPPGTGLIGGVWKVFLDGPRVVFVTHDRVICWEGDRFTSIVQLSETRRLLGTQAGGRIFIDHVPTGLYRVEQGVPHLLVSAQTLGPRAVLWLETSADGSLLLGTNTGFFRWRQGRLEPFAPEAADWMSKGRFDSAVSLPNGKLIVGTELGGVGVISSEGQLERILTQHSGLPERGVYELYRDGEGGIWLLGSSTLGRMTFDPAMVTAAGPSSPVHALMPWKSSVVASTDRGVFRLSTTGQGIEEEPVAPITDDCWQLADANGDLFVGVAHGFDRLSEGRFVPVLENVGVPGLGLAAAPEFPGQLWAIDSADHLVKFDLRTGPPPHSRPIGTIRDYWQTWCIDPQGRAWLGLRDGGVIVQADDGPAVRNLLTSEQIHDEPVVVLRAGGKVLAIADGGIYQSAEGSVPALEQIGTLPPASVLAAAADEAGDKIYVALERRDPEEGSVPAIGCFDRHPGSGPAWQEFALPGLKAVGQIGHLALGRGAEGPQLWIGGTAGVEAINIGHAALLAAPPQPYLDFADAAPRAGAGKQARWELPYADNEIQFQFGVPVLGAFRSVFYQTRLRDARQWSEPKLSPVAQFSYLREGSYLLEVRTQNAAGLTSAPLELRFAILPPWYRSWWAYISYFAATIALVALSFLRRSRRIEAANTELSRLVRDRTAELERASSAKDDFVARISHEIRNPLNGIIGLSAALEAGAADPAQQHQLEMMRQCSQHLSALIEEILDFAQIEAGAITIAAEPFNLRELLASVRAVLSDASSTAKLPIDLVVDPTVPAVLSGDAQKIRQILVNYVANALKYAGRGRVTLSAFAAPCGAERYDLTFVVGDEGPGIASAEQATLFTKFRRGAAAADGKIRGTGLGLAVCRTLAERMGGTTLVRSEVGKGAFFYLRLPLPVADNATVPVPEDLRFAGPMYALVVEDQEFNSAGLVAMLRQLGIDAEVAGSAEAALDRCRQQAFALYFLDRDLPRMSGIELARELRRREGDERRSVIIATTGAATRQARAECLEAGMDGFISKPITLEKLRTTLGEALGPTASAPAVKPVLGPGRPADPWRLDTLRYMANGDSAELVRRTRIYVRELDGYLLELQTALHAANFDKLRRTAHGLVGHLGIIEHAALLFAAQQIEESAVNRDLGTAAAKLTELLSTIHHVRGRLVADSESARSE